MATTATNTLTPSHKKAYFSRSLAAPGEFDDHRKGRDGADQHNYVDSTHDDTSGVKGRTDRCRNKARASIRATRARYMDDRSGDWLGEPPFRRPHGYGNLLYDSPGLGGDDQGLDRIGQVVRRVRPCEQFDGGPIVGPKARRHVGQTHMGHPREIPGEEAHGPPAGARRFVLTGTGEAGPDHDHRLGNVAHRFEQPLQVPSVVLAVGIDLHHRPKVVLDGVAEPDPHGAAHPEVEHVADHAGPGPARHRSSGVGGRVIHDEHLRLGHRLEHLGHHRADRGRLVERRNDHQYVSIHVHRSSAP